MSTATLILPGIGNSGPAHWQSLWEAANPAFVRVQQPEWEHPECAEWLETLEKYVVQSGAGVILIAHSLACLLVAHWATITRQQIKGALLVAPPDPDSVSFPIEATGFSPFPLEPFKFPSIVVASSNDPYGTQAFAQSCASAWGSRFVNIGAAGHISSNSGLGQWHEGYALYQQLVA